MAYSFVRGGDHSLGKATPGPRRLRRSERSEAGRARREACGAGSERARTAMEVVTVADVCDNYLVKYIDKNRGAKGAAEVRRMFQPCSAKPAMCARST